MEHKNWFLRHKIITGILAILVLFIIIGVLSGDREPTKIEEVKTNEPTKTTSNNYVIEITGTNGLEFTGSIGGGANQRSVQGSIPATYEVNTWPAVAVIQKKEASGTLTVTMKKNDRVLNSQTTDADYGVVTVSSS